MNKIKKIFLLTNRTYIREFEVNVLNQLGIKEIYCPKVFPASINYISATKDDNLDNYLDLPKEQLDLLNQQNWYDTPTLQAWQVVNNHFDVMFLELIPNVIQASIRHFKKVIIVRPLALPQSLNYGEELINLIGHCFFNKLTQLGKRFWFAIPFEHLIKKESNFIKRQHCYLPHGVINHQSQSILPTKDILLIYPNIGISQSSNTSFHQFKKKFEPIHFEIAGIQSIAVPYLNYKCLANPTIEDINQFKLIIHLNTSDLDPLFFKAIHSLRPVLYLQNSTVIAGCSEKLINSCRNLEQLYRKAKKILNNDLDFIKKAQLHKQRLAYRFSLSYCLDYWRNGLNFIIESIRPEPTETITPSAKDRVAIILPVKYRGGSLRGAKLLAETLLIGSKNAGRDIEIIFGYIEEEDNSDDIKDLPAEIKPRPYKWLKIDREYANIVKAYQDSCVPLKSSTYQIPDDQMNYFADCKLWIIISDRLLYPLLPVRPYVMMVYDYIQRYVNFLDKSIIYQFIKVSAQAQKVWFTTQLNYDNGTQYGHLNPKNIKKLPMIVPHFKVSRNPIKESCFIWTTNPAVHKNHGNAFKALKIYYEEYQGQLNCKITGSHTDKLLDSNYPHLKTVKKLFRQSAIMQQKITLLGELSDFSYQEVLSTSLFLWHPALFDNGTFSVIEAAYCNVPSLCSDYPPMQEIAKQYHLTVQWMDGSNPMDMAKQLKYMEQKACELNVSFKDCNSVVEHANTYWQAVEECL